MSDSPVATRAQNHLRNFAEGFRINDLPGVPVPEPAEWADFSREHPQYSDGGYYKLTALTLAGDRRILEEMSLDYQKLGGTLIRQTFNNEELLEISNRPAYAQI